MAKPCICWSFMRSDDFCEGKTNPNLRLREFKNSVPGNGQASARVTRPRHGVRWQSAAATPLSPAPNVNELLITFVRTKAAWRSAYRRIPKPRGIGRCYFETRLQIICAPIDSPPTGAYDSVSMRKGHTQATNPPVEPAETAVSFKQ